MQQDAGFIKVLNKFGFESELPEIFNTIEFELTKQVPDENLLIPVPLVENFPLKEPESSEIIEDIPPSVFETASFETLQKAYKKERDFSGETKRVIPDNMSAEDFVKIKREYQTYLSIISKERELGYTLEVCSYPTCMNVAVPSMKYCTYHSIENNESPLNGLVKNKRK